MKKGYIIKDLLQTNGDKEPFYFYGNYTTKRWTDKVDEAKVFWYREEAEAFVIGQESGIYEVKTIYTSY